MRAAHQPRRAASSHLCDPLFEGPEKSDVEVAGNIDVDVELWFGIPSGHVKIDIEHCYL